MFSDCGVRQAGVNLAVRANEPMAGHTTFRIGGLAQWFVTVASAVELETAVRWAADRTVAMRVIGAGTNLLVADSGVRGLVIENRIAGCSVKLSEATIVAGCGAMLSDLAMWSCYQGLAGLEWAVGIPGTVGGAVVGNAGAFGGYMGNVVRSVVMVNAAGQKQALSATDCVFAYRDSRFKRANDASALVEVELALTSADPASLLDRVSDYIARRDVSQPWEPCAGSVFKRTREHPAGWLVDQTGLKGARVGGAQISPQHANFIVNTGGATAADVLQLVEMARGEVWKRFGVALELELEYLS